MDRLVIGEDQRGGDREIIQQLKEKYHSTSERSVKLKVQDRATNDYHNRQDPGRVRGIKLCG